MHVRFSTALGLPVIDDDTGELFGAISGILIDPDTGKIEGFFVRIARFMHSEDLFLSTLDILRWGMRIVIRGHEVLSPIEDRIRLQTLLEEHRYFIGQAIVTDTNRNLGKCTDVQFDTDHFMVEWFWPKRFFQFGNPLPISQILEVRRDAILVRDPSLPAVEKEKQPTTLKAPILNQLPETA